MKKDLLLSNVVPRWVAILTGRFIVENLNRRGLLNTDHVRNLADELVSLKSDYLWTLYCSQKWYNKNIFIDA